MVIASAALKSISAAMLAAGLLTVTGPACMVICCIALQYCLTAPHSTTISVSDSMSMLADSAPADAAASNSSLIDQIHFYQVCCVSLGAVEGCSASILTDVASRQAQMSHVLAPNCLACFMPNKLSGCSFAG